MIILLAVFAIILCIGFCYKKINIKNDIGIKVNNATKMVIDINLGKIKGEFKIVKHSRCFKPRVSPGLNGLVYTVPVFCTLSEFITGLYSEEIRPYDKQKDKRLLDVVRAIVGAELKDDGMIALFDDTTLCETVERARESFVMNKDYFFSEKGWNRGNVIAPINL